MQIRIDDDMRAIVAFTGEEYALMGEDKDAVEAAVTGLFQRSLSARAGAQAPVEVLPGGEVAAPVETPPDAPPAPAEEPVADAPPVVTT
jgi:hypothetical protein